MYSNVPQAEVLDEAIKHAEKAYQLLPTLSNMTDLKGAPTNCRQYASKGAAATLLANIYAWRGSLKDLYGQGENSAEDYKKAVDYAGEDRKSTRLNSSHANISHAVFCLK